ncbi:MAG TPA: HAMP domain-containing sensor histidine kinase [Anaerolineales bacterium]|nr:HAMP domain-containing sensor histidine kinase [Anaerolineales bacterium]
MPLRVRLTFLYTSIVGGILLLFGVAVYASVSLSLISQVDSLLKRTADDIWPNIAVDVSGNLALKRPIDMELSPGLSFQIWNRDRQLIYPLNAPLRRPFDPAGLQSSQPVFRNVFVETNVGNYHMRAYTVPLVIGEGDRFVGTLQVVTSLTVVDATQRSLLWVLILGATTSMLVAGLAGWVSTRQALAPLGGMTKVAQQITRADDLSRRIPYHGPEEDEVGQLISAFNLTLSRLENLFNTQRRFLADVGHELRTPLTVIRGNVDLMRRMDCMDLESMESISNEVERLSRLVGDLLLLAQAESGKLPLHKQIVELDTILLQVMQQMRVLVRERTSLRLGEIDQVITCADQDRIKQVLVNLIGNAINYTPAGGEVVVGLGKEGEYARLTVSDNGPGIPPEDLPHIFERFYRGEKARTRQKDGKGYGLGLSIAYWIVRNHGGRIEVDSRYDVGTTFCVWLPLAVNGCPEEEIQG